MVMFFATSIKLAYTVCYRYSSIQLNVTYQVLHLNQIRLILDAKFSDDPSTDWSERFQKIAANLQDQLTSAKTTDQNNRNTRKFVDFLH